MKRTHEFSDKAEAALTRLMKDLDLEHSGEIINHSLGVLQWLVDNLKEENSIIVTRITGAVTIKFPEIQTLLKKKQSRRR